MEKEEHIENKKISKHDFYFELSLYKEIKLSEFEEDILKWEVDGYSSINHIVNTPKNWTRIILTKTLH